ncbi:MAG: hypothetical protein ABSB33_08670 [Tepidisphaeraceae bacterium]|jgi:hypothetical protein
MASAANKFRPLRHLPVSRQQGSWNEIWKRCADRFEQKFADIPCPEMRRLAPIAQVKRRADALEVMQSPYWDQDGDRV